LSNFDWYDEVDDFTADDELLDRDEALSLYAQPHGGRRSNPILPAL
jgi:hypothetical protein